MNRRSFLKLPALLPFIDLGRTSRFEDHHFAYESVIGTSLDLIVRSPSVRVAEGVPDRSEKKSIAWRRFSIRGIRRARSAFWSVHTKIAGRLESCPTF